MRVSKAFKVMAAPLLYERLEWRYMQKDPLRLEKDGGVIRGESGITTKESEFEYIKLIEIQSHWKRDCPCTGTNTRRGPLAIPILQIYTDTEDEQYAPSEDICLGNVICPLVKGLMPSKVVKMGEYWIESLTFGHINRHTMQDYVVHLRMDNHFTYPFGLDDHLHGQPQRLILILSWRDWPDMPWLDREIHNAMTSLANQLSILGRRPHSLGEIVLVNTDFWGDQFSDKTAYPKGFFEHTCRKAMEDFDPSLHVSLPARDGKRWRTAAEAALVSYKFITMQDYVRDYDRKGEYTNEEFERMMCGEMPLSNPAYKWW
jgi:hypothetical protein